jgi:hypothetical protein
MTVYAAFDDAALVVDDGDVVERRVEGRIECVAAADGDLFVGTRDEGLLRAAVDGSGGGGFEADGFEPVLEGHVTAVARHPDAGEWWAGTEPSAVYRSNAGEEWTELPDLTALPSAEGWSFPPRPHTHHVRWLEPDATDPGRWYVAIEAGALVRTDDGGATWRDRPDGARRDNHEVQTHPDAPGRVYAAAGDGYAESTDGGDTWDYPQEGLDERYCWSLAVDPADPDVRVLSAARSASQAHRSGRSSVYRRTGDDAAWERVDDLPHGDGAYRAVVAPSGAGRFYALFNQGLFRSEDAGSSWERVADVPERFRGEPPRGLAVT